MRGWLSTAIATGLVEVAKSPTDITINDDRFAAQLDEIRKLKVFLFTERVKFAEDDLPKLNLQALDLIDYHPNGRPPSPEEWQLLDTKLSVLSLYLDDRLRLKIRIASLKSYFRNIPMGFLTLAIFAILLKGILNPFLDFGNADPDKLYLGQKIFNSVVQTVGVICWTLALGGLGACAFIGTTMMSETARLNGTLGNGRAPGPTDSSANDFDLTDQNLLLTRIVTGVLFAFLLGLPISSGSLDFIVGKLLHSGMPGDSPPTEEVLKSIGVVLLPFVVGFSTTLVLGIMDRMVTSIKTTLGLTSK